MMGRFALLLAVAGCQGIWTHPASVETDPHDAAEPIDDPPAVVNEASQIRLEFIQNTAGQNTARATAFFYRWEGEGPALCPPPPDSNCIDVRDSRLPTTEWPFVTVASFHEITYRDVGGVRIHPSVGGSDLVLGKALGGADFLGNPHSIWWKKPPDFAANDGTIYFPPDQMYDVALLGSTDWPAQASPAYMPATFTPLTPATDATFVLPPGDFATTFTPINSPEHVGYQYRFTSPSFTDVEGVELPIVICFVDPFASSFTVPAEFVDIVRSYGSGHFIREVYRGGLIRTSRSYDTTWSAN